MKRIIVLISILSQLFLACKNESSSTIDVKASDKGSSEIENRMKEIISKTNYMKTIYSNSERVKMIFSKASNNPSDVRLQFQYATALLNDGQTEKALSVIKSIYASNSFYTEIKEGTVQLHNFEALCYLRLAEQKNCQENHTDQSCIVPIQEGGLHVNKSYSEMAVKKITEILKVYPGDYQNMWLLNVAYMTLGQYPDKVPTKFLVPIDTKNSEWQNIASATGVDYNDLSGGVITEDFDNDGYIDILTSSWSHKGKLKFYKNNGEGGFEDITVATNLDKIKGGLNMKQADYNNDGLMDFIILRGGWRPNEDWGILPNSLIKNLGNNKFVDVTLEANIYSENPTQSAEWLDYNQDGYIDLMIANETTKSSTTNFLCELYRNKGDGTFEEIANESNVASIGYYKGVSSGDINNDGFPDIYLSNLDGDNKLLLNVSTENNIRSFQDITSVAGVNRPKSSFPCWFFDYDNDGNDDIFASAYDRLVFTDQSGQFARAQLSKSVSTEQCKLYHNEGGNKFKDATNKAITASALGTMGCNFGDINNDGLPDFYLGTGSPDYRSVVPNRFFTNVNGNKFTEDTYKMGLGHIQKGHGISITDLDNDGDQDIYAVMGGAFTGDLFPNALFENPGYEKSKFFKLRLVGSTSNRAALGAKIIVEMKGGNEKSRKIYHTINSGASFGANSLLANIGLGDCLEILGISIKWPNGKNEYVKQEFDFDINNSYLIKEGETPLVQDLKTFKFKKGDPVHHHHHH